MRSADWTRARKYYSPENGAAAAVAAAAGFVAAEIVDAGSAVEYGIAIAAAVAPCLRSCPYFALSAASVGYFLSYGVASQMDQKLEGIGLTSRP